MIKERMLYLAEQIEHPTDSKLLQVEFDMGAFYHRPHEVGCKSAACAAGHACILFGIEGDISWLRGSNAYFEAKTLLGLTWDQAQRLFYNHGGYIALGDLKEDSFEHCTAQAAARAIRVMVEEEC